MERKNLISEAIASVVEVMNESIDEQSEFSDIAGMVEAMTAARSKLNDFIRLSTPLVREKLGKQVKKIMKEIDVLLRTINSILKKV